MWQIFKKEFLELARDKKTLIFTILLPTFIMPVIILAFGFLVSQIAESEKSKVLKYAVVGESEFPELVADFNASKKFEKVILEPGTDIKQAIQNKRAMFVVEIPVGAKNSFSSGEQVVVNLHYNNSSKANRVYNRVDKFLKPIAEKQQKSLLASLQLSEEKFAGLTKPLTINKVDTADKRESIGENIGGILTYFLIIITLTGAMYPALDLGIGEKERGTLETLLITPVPRSTIVIAKFLVIFFTGFISVFLSLTSILLWTVLAGGVFLGGILPDLLKIVSSIGLLDFSLMFAMLVPVAATFASIMLSISIYARNFKEAQNYMSPLIMIVIMPVVLTFLPGVKLDDTWAWVPLTNVGLAIKDLLKGTVDYYLLSIIFLSTSIIAGALLYFCTQWFNRESVLFRT